MPLSTAHCRCSSWNPGVLIFSGPSGTSESDTTVTFRHNAPLLPITDKTIHLPRARVWNLLDGPSLLTLSSPPPFSPSLPLPSSTSLTSHHPSFILSLLVILPCTVKGQRCLWWAIYLGPLIPFFEARLGFLEVNILSHN